MYFFFSKVLLFVILPVNWIIILVIISFIAKNKKVRTRCRVAALAVFIIFSMPALFRLYEGRWDIRPMPVGKQHYTCAIVLGGFSGFDDHGRGFFNSSADRFIQAAKLKDGGFVDKILITGGSGNLIGNKSPEAPWVREQLMDINIPDSAILIESKSKNTKENAAFTKGILDDAKIKGPYLLVTSAFHMRRSMYIFQKTGMDVVPYSCNVFRPYDQFDITDLLPIDVSTLSDWNFYAKELVGYWVAHLQK